MVRYMFLSQEETDRLTGRSRPSAQRKWLLEHGFLHRKCPRLSGRSPIRCRRTVGTQGPENGQLNIDALPSHCSAAGSSRDKFETITEQVDGNAEAV
jgi:hypothetical protein